LLRSGKVKRAKLFYLRGRIGSQATKVEEDKKETRNPEGSA
jgi:ribosomal protein L19